MTRGIGEWLIEVYLLSTFVLLVLGAVMSVLVQPARRLFVAWCGTVALIGLIGLSTWARCEEAWRALANQQPGAEARAPHVHGDSRYEHPEGIDSRLLQVDCCEPRRAAPAMGGNSGRRVFSLNRSMDTGQPASVDGPRLSLATVRAASITDLFTGTDQRINRGIVFVFIVVFGLMMLWLLVGVHVTAAVLAGTVEAPRELKVMLIDLVGTSRRAPGLRITRQAAQPFVTGIFRSTIVFPTRFVDGEEPACRVLAAMRHEWAHIQHADLVLLALLRVLLPVLFAHPAYWWLRRRIRADQETMADARAVQDGDRIGYARALLAWAQAAPTGLARSQPGSLTLWDRPGELRARLTLLLAPSFTVEIHSPCRWRFLVISTTLASVVFLGALSPVLRLALAVPTSPDGSALGADRPESTSSVLCCPRD